MFSERAGGCRRGQNLPTIPGYLTPREVRKSKDFMPPIVRGPSLCCYCKRFTTGECALPAPIAGICQYLSRVRAAGGKRHFGTIEDRFTPTERVQFTPQFAIEY